MNPLELVAKTLHSFGNHKLAVEVLKTFGENAASFSQFDDIAKIFFELKYFDEAIKYGESALRISQTKFEQYTTIKNLINAYNHSNYPERTLDAISSFSLDCESDYELALDYSFALSACNNKSKSYEILFSLLSKNLPDDIRAKVYHNLSGYYFLKDDINTGLKHFLRASEVEAYKNKTTLNYEKWNGEVKPGMTLIVDNECGAGDEVIHVRFMKKLIELGMNPIWLTTRRELSEVFVYNGFTSKCSYDNPRFSKDSLWVYSLALPYYLNLKPQDIGRKPYLKSHPVYDEKWSWMNEDKKFKVGLFWKSSSDFEQNHFRSVNLEDYMNVLGNYDFSVYSLQLWNENLEVDGYPIVKQTLSPKGRQYADTFSIINNLDLVVTSCSFTAHVAASLGKEVCVFIPIMEYYIWTSSGNYTWWYGDNVHMFKQKSPRCWKEPMNEFRKYLNTI